MEGITAAVKGITAAPKGLTTVKGLTVAHKHPFSCFVHVIVVLS